MAQKSYYGMSWAYGQGMHTETGRRAVTYVRFGSASDRDEWVSDGPGYRHESGYRDPIDAHDPGVRSAIRRDTVVEASEL